MSERWVKALARAPSSRLDPYCARSNRRSRRQRQARRPQRRMAPPNPLHRPKIHLTSQRTPILLPTAAHAGQQVLINDGVGRCRTFVVQPAKALGAEVTGVCSTRNVHIASSLGDQVIDYTREDVTRTDRRYDLLL